MHSRPNTQANYEYLLEKFGHCYRNRNIEAITTEEIIAFLATITEGRKQNTKRSRYTM
ncbi:phage integrase N-terminal SAM-like domain-containing protein [Desulfoprunum benzoelyticum]|nr:phage integrase N-terminal SAM-like domain-containing protein [Desulfoprunum benzoelyticum]